MNPFATEIIEFLISKKPMSPTLLVEICLAQGIEKKSTQITMQIGIERDMWHFNYDMKLAPGSRWDNR